jgi:hypothetical protein
VNAIILFPSCRHLSVCGGLYTRLNWSVWLRNGRFVYFERDKDPKFLMRVRVSDRAMEEVVGLTSFNPGGTSGGFWFGLMVYGYPLILHSTGTAEIYILDWKQPGS